jgi:hypothetical protein
MKTELTLGQLALIAATRGALGAGIGLLLAGRLPPQRRSELGWTLLAAGAFSTLPLMLMVARRRTDSS